MSLFVLTTVLSKSLVQSQIQERYAAQSQNADHEDQDQAHFSELSSDVVIPSVAFDFSSDFVLIPAPEFSFLETENLVSIVSKPIYRLSYFEKLFEHHIAINAP